MKTGDKVTNGYIIGTVLCVWNDWVPVLPAYHLDAGKTGTPICDGPLTYDASELTKC